MNSDFRKPIVDRWGEPKYPQNAIYRVEPYKPVKRIKGRKGKKPRGAKLKPRNLSQFNKFHNEAARNKARDTEETERASVIKDRELARKEKTDRLAIEDRRYGEERVRQIGDRREERNFRQDQLAFMRLQLQQAPQQQPNINIAPPNINIAPPNITINQPPPAPPAQPQYTAEQAQGDIRRGIREAAQRYGFDADNLPSPQPEREDPRLSTEEWRRRRRQPPPSLYAQPIRRSTRLEEPALTPEEQEEARGRIYEGLIGRATKEREEVERLRLNPRVPSVKGVVGHEGLSSVRAEDRPRGKVVMEDARQEVK